MNKNRWLHSIRNDDIQMMDPRVKHEDDDSLNLKLI